MKKLHYSRRIIPVKFPLQIFHVEFGTTHAHAFQTFDWRINLYVQFDCTHKWYTWIKERTKNKNYTFKDWRKNSQTNLLQWMWLKHSLPLAFSEHSTWPQSYTHCKWFKFVFKISTIIIQRYFSCILLSVQRSCGTKTKFTGSNSNWRLWNQNKIRTLVMKRKTFK